MVINLLEELCVYKNIEQKVKVKVYSWFSFYNLFVSMFTFTKICNIGVTLPNIILVKFILNSKTLFLGYFMRIQCTVKINQKEAECEYIFVILHKRGRR